MIRSVFDAILHHYQHKATLVNQPQQKNATNAEDNQGTLQPPTPIDVIRYRYHYGVNLGAVHVLEKWIFSSAFPPTASAVQSSEFECVKACTEQNGTDVTRAEFEARWHHCMDIDWDWFCNKAHGTTIRLPIGYFTLGPNYCVNTPFAPFSQVYVNAWSSVKSFVASAWSHGVGVLIDFHALPGGANTAEHSGTNSGVAALWNNEANLALATQCLEFLAREITSMNGVAGLQLCNEAIGGAPGMYQWYDAVIAAISVIDPTIPLFISDGWNTAQGIDYVKSKNKLIQGASPMTNPICVDSHQYFCFTEDNKSPQEVISSIPGQLSQLDGKNGAVIDTGAAQVIVGEWSCALSGATWSKVGTGDRKQLTTQFGKAQCDRWLQQAGGSFFWTLKMDWMDGGDWGFVEQTNTHAIHPPNNLTISSSDVQAAIDKAQRRMQEQGKASYLAHEAYWKQQAPDGSFEHERYQQGWNQGWNDALAFFSMRANGGLPGNGGDKIGMLELWVRKRVGEYGNLDSFAWEYETGLRKGVLDFYLCAGV